MVFDFKIDSQSVDSDSNSSLEDEEDECLHCYDAKGLCISCNDCEHKMEYIQEGKCTICGFPIVDETIIMKENYVTINPKATKNIENNNIQLKKRMDSINMTENLRLKIMEIVGKSTITRYSAPQMDTIILAYIYSAIIELKLNISPQRMIIQCKLNRGTGPLQSDEKKIKDVLKLFLNKKIVGCTYLITQPILYVFEFFARDSFPILGKEIGYGSKSPPQELINIVMRYNDKIYIKPQRIAAALIMKYCYPDIKTPPIELIKHFGTKPAAITKTIAELGLTKTKTLV